MVYTAIEQLIGNTPLIELKAIEEAEKLNCRILAKLESFNPAGSAKDRVGLSMINAAEAEGRLSKGGVIIEPTSGNTGIGLCAVAASRGYRCIIVMPDSMSKERIVLMKAYGAEVVLTPGKEGMSGAIKKAEELNASIPGSIIAGQFSNPANPDAHYKSTGPEIWDAVQGDIDILVATIGTGGTVTGTGRYLKERKPQLKVVGVEPASSPLLTKGYAGAHKIQGIGANFIPSILDTGLLDEVLCVSDCDAYAWARKTGPMQGFLSGISSGAAICAAVQLAKRKENGGKTIVAVLPDSGDRYLSTDLYED